MDSPSCIWGGAQAIPKIKLTQTLIQLHLPKISVPASNSPNMAADKARFYMEQSLPELQELKKKKIFTEASAVALLFVLIN